MGLSEAAFARTTLDQQGSSFEVPIPEGLDEVRVAAAFREAGCGVTYLTQAGTIVVETHEAGEP